MAYLAATATVHLQLLAAVGMGCRPGCRAEFQTECQKFCPICPAFGVHPALRSGGSAGVPAGELTTGTEAGPTADSRLRGNDGETFIRVLLQDSVHLATKRTLFLANTIRHSGVRRNRRSGTGSSPG